MEDYEWEYCVFSHNAQSREIYDFTAEDDNKAVCIVRGKKRDMERIYRKVKHVGLFRKLKIINVSFFN
ncbi:MAG: hypothetical protein FJZ43_00150 [Candidatus Staskawiczbacteria bacterium]|nr:hypothetical protein [Candidatus Staskawiczbacteria bacterium]